MTSKATKEMNIGKWGLKSGDSKSETKLQEYKKENAALKKSLEDIIKSKAQMKPDERERLLEEAAANCSGSPRNENEVEMQLKDALEKNHQWLIYDQQREAYVHSILARISELEQQLEIVNQEQAKESRTEGKSQRNYEYLLAAASKDLEIERHTVAQLHFDLNECKRNYDEAAQEVMNLTSLLKSQPQIDLQALHSENHLKEQMLQRLTRENEVTRAKLEEERTRTQAFSSQVELLHRSLLNEQEKHTKIAALEQQIQACTSDLENEKLDRQNLRHQLNKVLKLLGKSKEQKTGPEPLKHPEYERIEVLHNFETAFEDKLIIQDKRSSPKRSNLLDESFLECPKCKTRYPTSQHRELLAHIDFCAD
ncbi:centrosomal protein of 55 kDa isoform X3 [Tiliqua scincoides]|uniref:centrosomal protein of 55 kDa isoform X3 n=1 Tax=Tiliqua scincoides TaxID=71010 RepID=UPI0034621655